jgi:anti-sigma B factor antagonist
MNESGGQTSAGPTGRNAMKSTMPTTRRLEVETVGRVTVASFRDERIVNDDVIEDLGEEFKSLVGRRGVRNVLLNFGRVKALSSAALAKLFGLKKRVEAAGGQLRLCCVHPELMEVFHLHRPRKSPPLFQIHDDEQDALDSF